MSDVTAFNPLYTITGPAGTPAGTLQASVTIAAVNTGATAGLLPAGASNQIEFVNTATGVAFVNVGIAGAVVAATTSNYPIPGSARKVITVHQEVTGWSVILASGVTGASVIATRGSGL
jgi:hypothetical protein